MISSRRSFLQQVIPVVAVYLLLFPFLVKADVGLNITKKTQCYPLGKHMSILVEDAKENRIVVKAFLKKTPHTIDVAENGRIGVDKFVSGAYDLILMDMRMPVMDGYTATGEIRKWERENGKDATPIIALTAHALVEDRRKCLDAGCTDYLSKPLKKAALLEKILAILPKAEAV